MDTQTAHFKCEECKGTSADAGVCMTEGCSAKGTDLAACDCGDMAAHTAPVTTETPAVETPAA